ncbi:hypothetical protein CNY89_19550, partial [Amaricoccus sp. HAR-UPW-R2A-40]
MTNLKSACDAVLSGVTGADARVPGVVAMVTDRDRTIYGADARVPGVVAMVTDRDRTIYGG